MIKILLVKEVEYAVRVLDELRKESPLSAKTLSERQHIPHPFIYRILKGLEEAGILDVKRGVTGGYSLKVSCEDITLYDIANAFEKSFLVVECLKEDYCCGRNEKAECMMHGEFLRIQKILKEELKKNSIETLLKV